MCPYSLSSLRGNADEQGVHTCTPRSEAGTRAQVVEETLRWLEEQGAGAWLDQGVEHPHRLALSVRLDRLHDTYHRLSHAFSDRGLQASRRRDMSRPCVSSSARSRAVARGAACATDAPHRAGNLPAPIGLDRH